MLCFHIHGRLTHESPDSWLQRLLGKKTMENELLKEAVEYGRQKKWIAHVPLLPEDGE